MSDIEKYNERLNEIEQLRELKRCELSERAARRDLEIAEKQIFVEQKRRKWELKSRGKQTTQLIELKNFFQPPTEDKKGN